MTADGLAILRQENRHLRSLLDFSRRVMSERDVRAQLRLLCAELQLHAGCTAAAVVLRDPERGAVEAIEAIGLLPEVESRWRQTVRSAPDGGKLVIQPPEDLRCLAELPLEVGEEVLGVGLIYSPKDATSAVTCANNHSHLSALADAAAMAILNARLYAQSHRELRRRDALRKVVASISSELDLDSLLGRVVRSGVELLDADTGVISLIGRDGAARIHAVHNLPPSVVGAVIGPGDGITGQVLATRDPVVVANYWRDLPNPLPEVSPAVESGVAVPVWWQGQLMGVFGVMAGDPSRSFNDQDREVLELLASHVAIAIENARLFGEARDRLAELTGLQAASAGLAEELQPERALRVVAEEALSLSRAATVSIQLLRSDGREPEVTVAVGDVPPGPIDPRGLLVVPLRARGRTLGTLTADTGRGGAFHPRQVELLTTFANQAAISLDNARLYAELQSRLEEMVGLQRVGTLLLEEHDFDRVLRSICQQLQRLTDAGGVGLALLEEDPRFLEMRTVVGPSANALRGARIPTEGSFAAEALRTNRPQRSDDAQNDPRGYKQSLVLGNTRTLLSVPMKTRQRTVGVLSVYNKEGIGGFTDRDAELATFFANQAAAAIENARLYEQTREYAVVEERNRLARELHDSVTQSLFSVTLLSQAALNLMHRDPTKARERLERASELAQGALAEMRALIFQLRPVTLQEEGLLSAVKKHLSALHSRHERVVELQVTGSARRLPGAIEEAAFGILQESLNNVIKHSSATRAQVTLQFEGELLHLCTLDNGVGFDPTAVRARPALGLGMSSMRERAEGVGGRLVVESTPGSGTRVCVELPVPRAD